MPDTPTAPSSPPATDALPEVSRLRRLGTALLEYAGLLLVLGALVVFFSLRSPHFFSLRTFATLANQIPDLTVIAVGMTFVLIIAGIDLSVGSVLALSSVVMGVAMVQWGWPLELAIPLAMMVGAACGLANGAITVGWAIPPFIVTLGMLEIARGGAYLVTASRTVYIGPAVEPVGAPLPFLGFSPAFFVAIGVVLAGQVILSRTVFGRYVVAIGTNEEAVRLTGIDPRPVKLAVFVLVGMLTGLGAAFQTSRLAAANPNAGVGLELAAIAAVVIGGTSLMGGRGSVISSFFGVVIIAVLQTGLAQLGSTEPTKRVITGLVIVVAVIADAYRRGFSLRRWLER